MLRPVYAIRAVHVVCFPLAPLCRFLFRLPSLLRALTHTRSRSLSLSSVLLTPLLSSFDAVNPCRDVLFSRFSIVHWLASVDSRDCVMHMQLHLASEYANPIITVKLDRHRLSIADRPNETRVFLTLPPAALLSLPTWHLAKKSRLCAYNL